MQKKTVGTLPQDFNAVAFRGTFRDYQQKVLANANRHLEDKKIHIVAAPGSGKTVLGLELIRDLNLPTLVLSPLGHYSSAMGRPFRRAISSRGKAS